MTGATPSTSRKDYYGGDIKWLVSGDIHNKEIFDCEGRINELGVKNSNAKLLPKNSLLIALNGQGKTKGTVSILRVEATCNQSLVAIIPSNKVLVEYLYYCLHFQYKKIRGMAGNDSRKGLNMKLVREITFILPTLKEQQKIIKRLDDLDIKVRKAIELQKSQLQDLKKLEKSYLREAFNGELI
jgi:type I restriction enzyme S subunit